jgi:hypothetical protein
MMARVWLVRRRGGQWVAPGGAPAFELPLAELIFPLDIGTHRRVAHDPPVAAQDLPAAPASALEKVLIEVEPRDLDALEFTGYVPGVYDSPYSPQEVVRRLAARRSGGVRDPVVTGATT